jgi:hypothetical protein
MSGPPITDSQDEPHCLEPDQFAQVEYEKNDLKRVWPLFCNSLMAHAYATGCYNLKEIGQAFNLHYSTASRLVRVAEIAMNRRAYCVLLTRASGMFHAYSPVGAEDGSVAMQDLTLISRSHETLPSYKPSPP